MTRLVNLTPHPLTVIADDGTVLLSHPIDGPPARVTEIRGTPDALTTDDGVTIGLVELLYADEVLGLPAPQDGVAYVVSRVTAAAITARDDLLFPLDEVRDGAGIIVGCRRLGRFLHPTRTRSEEG